MKKPHHPSRGLLRLKPFYKGGRFYNGFRLPTKMWACTPPSAEAPNLNELGSKASEPKSRNWQGQNRLNRPSSLSHALVDQVDQLLHLLLCLLAVILLFPFHFKIVIGNVQGS